MIAGTLGPVASAFSICALVRPWRQSYPPGSDVQKAEYINDPVWLLVINAIQLAVAVVANLFLLLNMARRIRFTVAQPITFVTWYMSSFCLVILCAVSARYLADDSDIIWSQAFYYGIYAAVLYFIVASLMVVTFFGAKAGKYDKDFLLTASQRTLMLQTIMFLMYLLLGALVFSTIEGWNYLDTVYWADVTLFTVGFGDIYAQTHLGRALVIPYALIGVISLGLVIGSIRSLILERGRQRLEARMIEKKRRRLVRRMTRIGADGILEPIHDEFLVGSPDTYQTGMTEFERRGQEFRLMREIQHQAERRRRWASMAISATVWLVLWLVGAKIFHSCEARYQSWSYFDAFYFCFVSLTTIGYGDVSPISNAGKSFFVFWSLLALPTMTVLISNAGDTIVRVIRDGTNQLGNITILPGERGFKKDLKEILRMLSCGKLFEEPISETLPGFLGIAQIQPSDDSDDDTTDEAETVQEQDAKELDAEKELTMKQKDKDAEEMTEKPNGSPSKEEKEHGKNGNDSKPSKKGTSTRQSSSRSSTRDNGSQLTLRPIITTSSRRDIPLQVPTNQADYHVVLIEEIARVTQHLRQPTPHKYSFEEWAWYLKLIGEDESNAETHRRAMPHVHHRRSQRNGHGKEHAGQETDKGGAKNKPDGHIQWSWIGSRSPLMGAQEEAEWILGKLTQRLAQELKEVQRQSAGDGSKAKAE
jgi:potassium channel subfamily K